VIQRRDFLKRSMGLGGAFLGALGAASAGGGQAAGAHRPGRFVDAHVHIWSDDLKKYPVAKGVRPEDMAPRVFTDEEILHQARPSGVTHVVLIQMSYYGFDNSYMLDAIRRRPSVFRGVAIVDLHSNGVEAEMRRLAGQGVRGFRLVPEKGPAGTSLEGEGLDRMWRCGAKENLAMCLLINPETFPAVEKRCEKFPDTPIVIDHFGHVGLPGPIVENDLKALCDLARYANVKVKVSAYYAAGERKPPHLDVAPLVKRVYEAFGPKRLMWGSDCPYQVQKETYEDGITLVRDHLDFLSAEDKQWILRRTAEETFFR
jgi:predicted TIM-barrel fold metal-dependent hydrolase